MTARCPAGHESASLDYCDDCGAPLDRERPVSDTTTVTKSTPCPTCQNRLQPGDRFCEKCGHDLTATPSASRWRATITADHAFHTFLGDVGIDFPSDPGANRHVDLDADEITIGRSGDAAIDLTLEPVDPSVSRAHACLRRQADGSYAVVDLDSANGTWVNDPPTRIPPRTPVPLKSGEQIHLGAWTTITIERVGD